jgi:hypothetical protein
MSKKRLVRALMGLVLLAAVGGCKQRTPVEKMEDLVDEMCSCTTLGCRIEVLDEAKRLSRSSMSMEEQDRFRERQRAIESCLHPDGDRR